ncbi:LysR substrate-binding domain-containing protein [Pseudomonas parafulva]|uniref:LysR substrate-binding domain-containing protein n=1 Tax=Pseudomonas parafulva TaxID=157782 RepID=UPI000416000C|nr:LysR substrate-binding domain-containing protein [Pseudomonas parafulva]
MIDLNDLFIFVKVVEHGGFAAASRKIDVPKSRLSRRVLALEERLGVQLIHRSTRRFAVTEIGMDYYRHCQAMVEEAEAAEARVLSAKREPQGIIRITCPPGLGALGANAMIADFIALYPKVLVHLESTNRVVDPLSDGVDIALRVRFPPLADDGLVVKRLGDSCQRLVASPDLAAGYDHGDPLQALAKLPTMALWPARPTHEWVLFDELRNALRVQHVPKLVTSDLSALHHAALIGVGAVQLPEIMVRGDLAAGRLVELSPHYRPQSGLIHAVFTSRKALLPAVRALLDMLGERFALLET